MTFYQRLRFRTGMFWTGALPPVPWRAILIVLIILLVYGLVDRIDRLGDRAARMERTSKVNAAYAQVLLDCMSGASGFYFKDTQQAFECRVMPL